MKKMYNEKFENYPRGSATVDFFFFLALILCVAFAVSALVSLIGWKKRTDTEKIIYTVKISHISDEVAKKIREGDDVIDSVGKYSIGTVKKIEITKTKIEPYYTSDDGISGEGDEKDAGYSDITVFISAYSTNDGNDITSDGYVIKVGRKMYLRFPYFSGEGICTSIRDDKAEEVKSEDEKTEERSSENSDTAVD